MTINMKNISIKNCGTGIKAGKGLDLDIQNLNIGECKTGIDAHKDVNLKVNKVTISNTQNAFIFRGEETSYQAILKTLNLPEDVPEQYLKEAIELVQKNKENRTLKALFKESKLGRFLGPSANVATIISLLLDIIV